jgi:hypothetical protein
MKAALLGAAGFVALAGAATPSLAADALCIDCVSVRIGPPTVIRGPFPDELDATFSALKLPDGTFRGFSANGTTYAIDGPSLADLDGERRPVLDAGEQGSVSDCGLWLTSVTRLEDKVVGFVHQERSCNYDLGQTDKSMAIATSTDDGLTWTMLGTIITGRDAPKPATMTGEGDCSLVDGRDGYLYAYCIRFSDWQTIAARTPVDNLLDWHKYFEGNWTEPGLGGQATVVGFLGPGAAYVKPHGWIATVATDPWFNGLRLSLSTDKVAFVDLDEPLMPIDGSDWNRPADTDLIAYLNLLNPEDGSNAIDDSFILSYVYVPKGKGFESRYLVQHEVSLSVGTEPVAVQAAVALTRWLDPERDLYVTSTGPLTGDRLGYTRDAVVAYLLTRAPDGIESVKLAECSNGGADQLIAEDGTCEADGYARERTAGWLYVAEQPGSVPVYRCHEDEGQTHFASSTSDCEGLGEADALLGYGLAP